MRANLLHRSALTVTEIRALFGMLNDTHATGSKTMRLLLVEDDPMIAEPVLGAMRREGYAIDWAHDGRVAQLSLGHDVYDLVLLDLGLPKQDGIDVLDAYRKAGGAAPVIILTARDAVDARIRGLDTGADDYLVKPFDLDELAARVRALLRRRTGQKQPVYTHGALALDPAAHEVTKDGNPVALLPREFALLRALIERPTRVFTKAELEEKIYGWSEEIGSNAVEVHVHSLRRKIGADEIVTVRGVGYRLRRVQ
jgi:two-component system, OmpR family, response regulator QseB